MSIYHDLEAIKSVALEQTKKDGYNYNIILHNPNDKGEFDLSAGSTYEFVMDSYFNEPRPNAILLYKTRDLLQEKEVDRLIDGVLESAERFDEMKEAFTKIDHDINFSLSAGKGNKLKEGLSMVHAEADGVTYKQGKAGLERVSHANRNDPCPVCEKEGIKIKFKKCNKHNG